MFNLNKPEIPYIFCKEEYEDNLKSMVILFTKNENQEKLIRFIEKGLDDETVVMTHTFDHLKRNYTTFHTKEGKLLKIEMPFSAFQIDFKMPFCHFSKNKEIDMEFKWSESDNKHESICIYPGIFFQFQKEYVANIYFHNILQQFNIIYPK